MTLTRDTDQTGRSVWVVRDADGAERFQSWNLGCAIDALREAKAAAGGWQVRTTMKATR